MLGEASHLTVFEFHKLVKDKLSAIESTTLNYRLTVVGGIICLISVTRIVTLKLMSGYF